MSLLYVINTDVSGRAIGAVLIQTIGEDETLITSTASLVINPTEKRYYVTEQEK
jgi:hypothetical protein